MTLEANAPQPSLWEDSAAEPDWDAVFSRELPRVYNFLRYRLGRRGLNVADVEDLTSRVFEKAWQARRRYRRDIATFTTWLLTIARNVAADHLRAARAHVALDEAADLPADNTPAAEVARRSDAHRLAALMAQLPDQERELLALKYGAGATNRSIAAVSGLSESNVGTILHRAVQKLRAGW